MTQNRNPDSQTINTAVALERLNGDTGLLKALAGFFLEDAPQLLEQLHEGVRTHSLPEIVNNAHRLRGLASSFEALAFVELSAKIEKLGPTMDASQLRALAQQLDAEFTRLIAAVDALRR